MHGQDNLPFPSEPITWGIREFDGHPVLTATVDGILHYENVGLCGLLLHSNPSKALADWTDLTQRISLDVRGANSLTGWEGYRRGNPNRAFVTREGANRLLLKSKAPGADRVHRWLADDVMPALEDQGTYAMPGAAPRELAARPNFVGMDEQTLMFVHRQSQDLALYVQALIEEKRKTAELLPGAELAATYAAANGVTAMRSFARDVQQWARERGVRVLQQQVFDYLGHLGLIIRARTSEHGQATAFAIAAGHAENETVLIRRRNGVVEKRKYGKLTAKGEDHAFKRIRAAITEHGTLDV